MAFFSFSFINISYLIFPDRGRHEAIALGREKRKRKAI